MKEKFTAGVIKKIIDFSKDTRTEAYNKFSEFVTKSTTLDQLQKNARKYGYTVQDQNDIATSAHKIGQVGGSGIKDALKWVWKAKEGEVSPLYEAGDNDYLLVVYLNKIHPQGYRGLDDPQVKEIVKREVLKDKKAEMIMAKLKGVNSIQAAAAKGGKVSTVDKVTFASPALRPDHWLCRAGTLGCCCAHCSGQVRQCSCQGQRRSLRLPGRSQGYARWCQV